MLEDTHNMDVVPQEACEAGGKPHCSGRREFLVRASVATGGLVLGLSGLNAASAQTDENKSTSADVVVKLKEHQGLYQVGGSEVIETAGGGKVILARPDAENFIACSAICTHRGGQLAYDHSSKQFVCPSHGARFDLSGKVAKGPAQRPVQAYTTDPALILGVKPTA